MEQLISDLKALCASAGVAGAENGAAGTACRLLERYLPDVRQDALGSVTGLLAAKNPQAKTLLLDAHLDEIGMIVTAIDEKGFLRVSRCGGLDPRVLAAQYVTIHGKKPLRGVTGSVPPHLQKSGEGKKLPEADEIFIDVGLSKEEAERLISLGDRVTIDAEPMPLLGDRFIGKALDNRAGCACLLAVLEALSGEELPVNLAVQFSAREETGAQGAATASFRLQPDLALVVDVSFAMTPDSSKEKCGELGKGPMIGFAPSLDGEISKKLSEIAEAGGIPWQPEVMGGRGTGTNADVISVSRAGVPCGLVSIPQRYMHTPAEMVQLSDIADTARLIAAFIRQL